MQKQKRKISSEAKLNNEKSKEVKNIISSLDQNKHKIKVGFIGQGFVGKNQADDYERRGYKPVRYSLEPQFVKNKKEIGNCDIVFIAVPTPTTPEGFDDSIVRQAVSLVAKGKIAVIKSTVLPGTTESIQQEYPDRIVLHAPEFLSEATASRDAAFPDRNIVGIPKNTPLYTECAKLVLSSLPTAPYNKICSSREAELIKYARNTMGLVRIVFVNILYDLSQSLDTDWSNIEEAISNDPQNGPTYSRPLHKTGRGAGGHCFIKDFGALKKFFASRIDDKKSMDVLASLEAKNIELLLSTQKDLDLLKGVYGENIII
jgi:nucleotide sugar dehydrogenase